MSPLNVLEYRLHGAHHFQLYWLNPTAQRPLQRFQNLFSDFGPTKAHIGRPGVNDVGSIKHAFHISKSPCNLLSRALAAR